jgi:hypothetical protein
MASMEWVEGTERCSCISFFDDVFPKREEQMSAPTNQIKADCDLGYRVSNPVPYADKAKRQPNE